MLTCSTWHVGEQKGGLVTDCLIAWQSLLNQKVPCTSGYPQFVYLVVFCFYFYWNRFIRLVIGAFACVSLSNEKRDLLAVEFVTVHRISFARSRPVPILHSQT
jgi:hypothetical protein